MSARTIGVAAALAGTIVGAFTWFVIWHYWGQSDLLCNSAAFPSGTLFRGESAVYEKSISLMPVGVSCVYSTSTGSAELVRENWLTVPGALAVVLLIGGCLLALRRPPVR